MIWAGYNGAGQGRIHWGRIGQGRIDWDRIHVGQMDRSQTGLN